MCYLFWCCFSACKDGRENDAVNDALRSQLNVDYDLVEEESPVILLDDPQEGYSGPDFFTERTFRLDVFFPGGEPLCRHEVLISEYNTFFQLHDLIREAFKWTNRGTPYQFYWRQEIDVDQCRMIVIHGNELLSNVFNYFNDSCYFYYYHRGNRHDYFYVRILVREIHDDKMKSRIERFSGVLPNEHLVDNYQYYQVVNYIDGIEMTTPARNRFKLWCW